MYRRLQCDNCQQPTVAGCQELLKQQTSGRRACLYVVTPLVIVIALAGIVWALTRRPPHCKGTVDPLATYETCNLYHNLRKKLHYKVMFGHQDTLVSGVGWDSSHSSFDKNERSDIYDIVKDYPAVYGWDVAWASDSDRSKNVDGVPFHSIKRWTIEAYRRGGVNTFSMHLNNPMISGGYKTCFNSTPEAVPSILPGKKHHHKYLKYLDWVAAFFKDLKDDDGTYVPIIFRPYHEHNQKWSWWGKSACTEAEYVALWKMTIKYLRDTHELHHLLYAISPQDPFTKGAYMERYPGDDYVDILGLDWYGLGDEGGKWQWLGGKLSMLGKLAEEKKKPFAITEVGYHTTTIPSFNWWTEQLIPSLTYDNYSISASWLLVWRNVNEDRHYAPYPGSDSEEDFRQFYNFFIMVFNKRAKAIGLYSD